MSSYRTPLAMTGSLLIAATGLGVASPASAATSPDPELVVAQDLRGLGESSANGPVERIAQARAVVSNAAANARMSRLLPVRAVSSAIGKRYALNVVDVQSGATIWSHQPKKALLPASNMKLVTAVDALTTLGPNKRFMTKIVSLGSGDATLSMYSVAKLAKAAAKAIKADPALLPTSYTPTAHVPATCVVGGKKHQSTKKQPCPKITPAPRLNKVKVYVDDSYYPKPYYPSGWRSGYEPEVVRPVRALGMDGRYVMDSGRDTASYLAAKMGAAGLGATYSGRTVVATLPRAGKNLALRTLATHLGATVYDQVRYMLTVSENNIAEMLFRNVAKAQGYKVANWDNSRDAAIKTLTKLGIPTASLSLRSGSGVSRNDRLTPIALTTLLRKAADRQTHPELSALYFGGGMPLSGRTGTLSAGAGRYVTSPTKCAAGKIRAKTGTLFDTIGLSGLTTGNDGRLKAFSILVNNRPQSVTPLTTRRAVDTLAATVNGCY